MEQLLYSIQRLISKNIKQMIALEALDLWTDIYNILTSAFPSLEHVTLLMESWKDDLIISMIIDEPADLSCAESFMILILLSIL